MTSRDNHDIDMHGCLQAEWAIYYYFSSRTTFPLLFITHKIVRSCCKG